MFDALGLEAAIRTAYAIEFHHHSRLELEATEIPYFAFIDFVNRFHAAPTSGAHRFAVALLAPHPELQCFGLFINLMLVYPIAGPAQDSGPIVVSQSGSVAETPNHRKIYESKGRSDSCGEPKKDFTAGLDLRDKSTQNSECYHKR